MGFLARPGSAPAVQDVGGVGRSPWFRLMVWRLVLTSADRKQREGARARVAGLPEARRLLAGGFVVGLVVLQEEADGQDQNGRRAPGV